MNRRTRDLDVEAVRLAILKFAHDHNIDSAILMQAIAEISGMVAAVCDREVGLQSFDERMADFNEHARAFYLRGLCQAVSISTQAAAHQ